MRYDPCNLNQKSAQKNRKIDRTLITQEVYCRKYPALIIYKKITGIMKSSPVVATLSSKEKFMFSSWWVILFTLICYMSYEHGLKKKDLDFAHLNQHYLELQRKKIALTAQQESLKRQVNSLSDPAWLELVLMKGLGLTPEGQIKVLFTSQIE